MMMTAMFNQSIACVSPLPTIIITIVVIMIIIIIIIM